MSNADSDIDAEGEDDVDLMIGGNGSTPQSFAPIDPTLFAGGLAVPVSSAAPSPVHVYQPSNGHVGDGRVYQSLYSETSNNFAGSSSQSNGYSGRASPSTVYPPGAYPEPAYNPYAVAATPTYQAPIDHEAYYAALRGASPPRASPSRPQRNRQRTSSSVDSGSRSGAYTSASRAASGSEARKKAPGNIDSGKAGGRHGTPGGRKHRVKAVGGGHPRDLECSFCMGTDQKNREGAAELMLSCDLCGRSGHPSCMSMTSPRLLKTVRKFPWQCIDCKMCEICQVKGNDNRLMFCDGCDRGWHCYCLDPPITKPPKGTWMCPLCKEEDAAINRKKSRSSSSHTLNVVAVDHVDGIYSSNPSKKGARPATKMPITNGFSMKRKEKEVLDGGFSPSPSEVVKRKTKMTASSDAAPTQSRPSTVIKIRLPGLPAPNAGRKRKRAEVVEPASDDVMEDPEEPSLPFGGAITGADADTRATTIRDEDRAAFERARTAAEVKLGAVLLSSTGETLVAPSTPPPSDYGRASPPSNYSPSGSPAPQASNTFRPLRDRVLLQQSNLPHIPPPGAEQLIAGTASRGALPYSQSAAPGVLPVATRIQAIRFDMYDIATWYSAPYPEEYSKVPDGRLWICPFCLKYMKTGFVAERHAMKCKMRHPPGDEIYKDGAISVFEVDGRKNKIYCQNLCLLAKMFLDHKTLYYDVEPFLFYVMTEFDDGAWRFVGYFSKEKRSPHFNVSCIMTLPIRQRKGWGNLLIDFSYLLSKKEGRVGSPEKPLSALGALSYRNYWTSTVMRFLDTAAPPVTLEDIAKATSMTLEDILATLKEQDMIDIHDPPPVSLSQSNRKNRPVNTNLSSASLSAGVPSALDGVGGGIARQALSRSTVPKDPATTALPSSYTIHWDPTVVRAYTDKIKAKGLLELRPEKLKYTPFLVARNQLAELLKVDGTVAMGADGSGSGSAALALGEQLELQRKDAAPEAPKEQVGAPMEKMSAPLEEMPAPLEVVPAAAAATAEVTAPGSDSVAPPQAPIDGDAMTNVEPELPQEQQAPTVVPTPAKEKVRYLTPPPRSMRSATRTPKTTVPSSAMKQASEGSPAGTLVRGPGGRFARKL